MRQTRWAVFTGTRQIEAEIDEFLDKVSEAGIVYEAACAEFLQHGPDAACQARLDQLTQLEARGDELRRGVETALYTQMLIPESRGDVLSLLDHLDELLDRYKRNLMALTIERPAVAPEFQADFQALVAVVVKSIEAAVLASRAYFRDAATVRDHAHKVGFYEKEADHVALRLKRAIFDSGLPLAEKLHLRYHVDQADQLADEAERVGDHLSIAALKRSL